MKLIYSFYLNDMLEKEIANKSLRIELPVDDHQIQLNTNQRNELSQHSTMSWRTSEYTA